MDNKYAQTFYFHAGTKKYVHTINSSPRSAVTVFETPPALATKVLPYDTVSPFSLMLVTLPPPTHALNIILLILTIFHSDRQLFHTLHKQQCCQLHIYTHKGKILNKGHIRSYANNIKRHFPEEYRRR